MRLATSLPAGVSALLFESAKRLRAVEAELVGELEAAGFGEALLPIVDYAAPYEPILPPGARAELYRFADREGELLALRADFTPLLARLLAPHLPALPLPLRIFYRGDVVRCPPRAARGARERSEQEQYQLGGELLGRSADGPALEREAALLFARLFDRATGGRGRLVLGLAGALDELLYAAAGEERAGELARAVARRERGAARTPSAGGAALLEIVELGAPADASALGQSGAAALSALRSLAAEIARATPRLGVAVDLAEFADFSAFPGGEPEGRDLRSYYGGLVFRGYLPGVARPIASGGRYDELFRRLARLEGAAAPDLVALGFSLRLDPLAASAGPARELPR